MCAAESEPSAFEFISVDCDLCRSGEVSFRQRKSEAAESLQLHGLLLRRQRNPGCNCDLLCGIHGVIERPRRACSYMDFCCDCNVTQDVTATYGNIAKVVCAAESQQSTFDFISVDYDLCRSGEVSF